MNVACPECRSVFRVDPAKVPAGGVRARCSVCGAVMSVDAPTTFGEDSWTPGAPTTPPTPVAAAPLTRPSLTPPPVTQPTFTQPTLASPAPAPVMPTPVRQPTLTPPTPTPPGSTLPRYPAVAGSGVGTPAGAAFPAAAPPRAMAPASPVATPAPAPTRPAPAGPTGGERPPINPFLANDPNQKAKRLARALVSDIVAYHPQQREQGLRDGTLRQLFKDEIKKSYEEYIEQVGAEFAESTAHFQEALNDILASGRKMF